MCEQIQSSSTYFIHCLVYAGQRIVEVGPVSTKLGRYKEKVSRIANRSQVNSESFIRLK